MNLSRKIIQIVLLIFFASFIASCDDGCVEVDEFNVASVTIDSDPVNDGISGSGDNETASWHETGLKSDGDLFFIETSGAWTSWDKDEMSSTKLTSLSRCDFCAKQTDSPNCICYQYSDDGATYYYSDKDSTIRSVPVAEKGDNGEQRTDVDCSLTSAQNDPDACTCTQDSQYGTALDYEVYHFPLNVFNKDQTQKIADEETTCKFDRGMGLYIGLFGSSGNETPLRLYHLFSEYSICNVTRDSNGNCVDSDGNDMTRYVFESANSRIFMKDDKNGNNGTDTDTSDDEYHSSNEYVKLKVYDNRYSDNYGQYNISILRGVFSDSNEDGLLEFLVKLAEDTLLGEIDSNGERQGGIIEFMYESVVEDSGFILALQVALSLYIAIFGAAHMFGVAEIWSKKELLSRLLKIALIIFFTSSSSWYFYDKLVVGLFKDSMDYVVAMIMSLSDSNIDPTSMTVIAQMDRASDLSSATRFSYVDLIIEKLLSLSVAKKTFGLFFGSYYGLVLIPGIYFLIAYFVYVMLSAAISYVVNLMKIIFVLSLGPIFMCFTLFSHTSQMFKNWLGFLGARSIEIIMLFTVLYNFLTLIDQNFTELFSYRACLNSYNVGLFSLDVLKSYISDRSLLEWLVLMVTIGGLTFILQLIIGKINSLAGYLITIGGVANMDSATGKLYSQSKMGGSVMGDIYSLAKTGASAAFNAGSEGGAGLIRAGTAVARASGIAGIFDKIGGGITDATGVKSPRSYYRNSFIDSAISKAQKDAAANGLKGKEADSYVRSATFNALQNHMLPKDLANSDSKRLRMALAGIDSTTIGNRLEEKLVKEPLKQAIKDEAAKIKGRDADKIPLGKEMQAELMQNVSKWAEDNLIGGSASAARYLDQDKFKKSIDEAGELTTSQAAKLFAGDQEKQNQYLKHLKDREFENRHKRSFSPFDLDNPATAQQSFVRKTKNEEEAQPLFRPRANLFDPDLGKRTEARQKEIMLKYLASDEIKPGEEKRREFYQKEFYRLATKDLEMAPYSSRQDLLARAQADLIIERSDDGKITKIAARDGKSLFEVAARMDYLHQKFGFDGASPLFVLSKFTQHQLNYEAKKIEDSLRGDLSAKDLEKARQDAENLKALRSGLFARELVLKDKDSGDELGKALSFSAANAGLKTTHGFNAGEINQHQAQNQERLDTLNKKIAEKEVLMQEEEKVRQKQRRLLEEVLKVIKSGTDLSPEAQKDIADKVSNAADNTIKDDHVQIAEQLNKSVQDKADEIAQKLQEIEKNPDDTKKSELLEGLKKDYNDFVAKTLEVAFGSSLADVLLKDPEVGLQVSNILLGVADAEKRELSKAQINALKIVQNQAGARLKMEKMNLAMKKFELDQTKKSDPSSAEKLEAEVNGLENKVKNLESELGRLDTSIATIEAA